MSFITVEPNIQLTVTGVIDVVKSVLYFFANARLVFYVISKALVSLLTEQKKRQ